MKPVVKLTKQGRWDQYVSGDRCIAEVVPDITRPELKALIIALEAELHARNRKAT